MIDPTASTKAATHIPRGVADYFWAEAHARRTLENDLLDLFRSWGYGDVIAPIFEFADVVRKRANQRLQEETYTFLGRDGSTLALRPDMTIPVARLVGTRLHDWPMPQRFCYAGSVFRYTETRAGRQREFHQAGIELIGAAGPRADAEVVALAVAALRKAGLDQFRMVIGHLGFFGGLLQELDLEPTDEQALTQAVDRQSEAELTLLLESLSISVAQQRTLEELPALSGADADDLLERANKLCLNSSMQAALDNLHAILDALAGHGVADSVYLDLTEINNLGYYTGITFEALAPGLGFPLASGGSLRRPCGNVRQIRARGGCRPGAGSPAACTVHP